jgi:hypothetical protein
MLCGSEILRRFGATGPSSKSKSNPSMKPTEVNVKFGFSLVLFWNLKDGGDMIL